MSLVASSEYPASSFEARWFRSIISNPKNSSECPWFCFINWLSNHDLTRRERTLSCFFAWCLQTANDFKFCAKGYTNEIVSLCPRWYGVTWTIRGCLKRLKLSQNFSKFLKLSWSVFELLELSQTILIFRIYYIFLCYLKRS